jgi:hypothetical protein
MYPVTAMAVGQRQRLYSGVRMFTGNYLTSTPRALRIGGVYLELTPLILISIYRMSISSSGTAGREREQKIIENRFVIKYFWFGTATAMIENIHYGWCT